MNERRIVILLLAALSMAVPAGAAYRQGFNCGDNRSRTTGDGAVYDADRLYTSENGAGRIGGTPHRPGLLSDDSDIGGLVPDVQVNRLLASRVESWDEYRFDAPRGRYLVSLHLLETVHHWRGLRRFSVVAEGTTLIDSLDLFDRVDRRYALNLRRVVDLVDGQLNLHCYADLDQGVLQGVHVERLMPDATAPPIPTELRTIASYGEIVLLWDAVYARDQLGVRVSRSDLTGGGPEIELSPEPMVAIRYRDRAVVAGHEYRYRLTSVDAWGNESEFSAAVVEVPLRSSDSPLRVHEFEMAEADLVDMYTYRHQDHLRPALYQIEERLWPDAGMRLRGNDTRSLNKKNYKVRAPNDDPFPPNRTKLNLQGEWRIPSPLRQTIGYRVFEWAGAMASRADYLHLERSGEFIGVYVDIEQVDEHFLDSRGLSGTIWRGTTEREEAICVPLPRLEDYFPVYSLEVGEYGDYIYLDRLFRVVTETDDETFRTEIQQHLDVEGFLRWYAAHALISNWDHVIHNYFLFRSDTTGLITFIPWDLDLAWERVRQAIDFGTRDHKWLFVGWNRLFDRLMHHPQYKRIYATTLNKLMAGPVREDSLITTILDDHVFLRSEVERDLYKAAWESMDAYDSDSDRLTEFVVERFENIREQLVDFAPDPSVNLFLNEALRWNTRGIRDEAGETEAWIEIHNFGIETLDLSGFGISDDPRSPLLWSLPAGSTVDAGGHLLVWLDGEPGEGPMHADFRAGRDTRVLLISRPDGAPIDHLLLPEVALPDIANARTPDGGGSLRPVARATPGEPNDTALWLDLELEIATELMAGDTVAVEARVENKGHLPARAELEISVALDRREVPLARLPLSVGAGRTWRDTLGAALPPGLPVVRPELRGRLTLATGPTADLEQVELQVRDPRPIVLVINELMAANDTTVVDEADQFDDWFEIFNPGPRSVALEGLYLSDDAALPTKWRFASGRIGPGEYLVVWCDDDTEQGPAHTSFKLDADGEEIGLYDYDARANAPIDRIVFGSLPADASFGRSPDGSPNLVVLPWATPGAPNP